MTAGIFAENTTGGEQVIVHPSNEINEAAPVRAGVPESVAMRITGHKTRSVFERYNITSERDLDEAARKVERYIGDLSQRLVKESAKRERAEVKASTVVQ